MTDDHDRLINLVVRLEAQEVGMAELKKQVGTMHDQRTEEAINCPFWPGKGTNGGGDILKRIEKIETRFAQIYWLAFGIFVGNGATLLKDWWPTISGLLKP